MAEVRGIQRRLMLLSSADVKLLCVYILIYIKCIYVDGFGVWIRFNFLMIPKKLIDILLGECRLMHRSSNLLFKRSFGIFVVCLLTCKLGIIKVPY